MIRFVFVFHNFLFILKCRQKFDRKDNKQLDFMIVCMCIIRT